MLLFFVVAIVDEDFFKHTFDDEFKAESLSDDAYDSELFENNVVFVFVLLSFGVAVDFFAAACCCFCCFFAF